MQMQSANTKRKSTPDESFCEKNAKSKVMCTELSTREIPVHSENLHKGTENRNKKCNVDVNGFESRTEPEKQASSELCVGQPTHATVDSQHSDPITGGVITTRTTSTVIPCRVGQQSNRMHVVFAYENDLPSFPKCPDWVKPLMFVEYQVGI